MAETVLGITVKVEISGTILGSDGAKQVILANIAKSFSDGAGANKVGQAWWDKTRNLDTTTENLDLAGTLATFNGDTLGLTDLKVLLIENKTETTGDDVILKNGASNPVGIMGGTNPTLPIGPGGFLLLVDPIDGITVTGGSADTIGIETTDDVDYQILVVGENT